MSCLYPNDHGTDFLKVLSSLQVFWYSVLNPLLAHTIVSQGGEQGC